MSTPWPSACRCWTASPSARSRKVAKASTLKEYPTDLTKAEDHIKAVCERMRDYGKKVREAIDTTDEAGDADTADLFTAASRTADKDLWFMESHLE